MATPQPFVALYRNRRTGEVLIEKYGKSSFFRGALEPLGGAQVIPADVLRSSGLARVRDSLEAFRSEPELPRDWKPESTVHLSPSQFFQVGITLLQDGSLELDPNHRGERGGYVGSKKDERLLVRPEASAEEFLSLLEQAFGLCAA